MMMIMMMTMTMTKMMRVFPRLSEVTRALPRPEKENFPGFPGVLSGLSGCVGLLKPAPHSSQGAFKAT